MDANNADEGLECNRKNKRKRSSQRETRREEIIG